jgi:DNA-directed RNA polymerase specialized sigma24 family protein
VGSPARKPFEELLENADFSKTIAVVAREVGLRWQVCDEVARGLILSAIGEPETLANIHHAYSSGQTRRAKLIIRRRVIDLLRKDARRENHCSLLETADAHDAEYVIAVLPEAAERSPQVLLEFQQIVARVRTALESFAARGTVQERQAQLLRRYMLEEIGYSQLSIELMCPENALRVRVHKAMLALRRHVQQCHPDLQNLVERRSTGSGNDVDQRLPAPTSLPRAAA